MGKTYALLPFLKYCSLYTLPVCTIFEVSAGTTNKTCLNLFINLQR